MYQQIHTFTRQWNSKLVGINWSAKLKKKTRNEWCRIQFCYSHSSSNCPFSHHFNHIFSFLFFLSCLLAPLPPLLLQQLPRGQAGLGGLDCGAAARCDSWVAMAVIKMMTEKFYHFFLHSFLLSELSTTKLHYSICSSYHLGSIRRLEFWFHMHTICWQTSNVKHGLICTKWNMVWRTLVWL